MTGSDTLRKQIRNLQPKNCRTSCRTIQREIFVVFNRKHYIAQLARFLTIVELLRLPRSKNSPTDDKREKEITMLGI